MEIFFALRFQTLVGNEMYFRPQPRMNCRKMKFIFARSLQTLGGKTKCIFARSLQTIVGKSNLFSPAASKFFPTIKFAMCNRHQKFFLQLRLFCLVVAVFVVRRRRCPSCCRCSCFSCFVVVFFLILLLLSLLPLSLPLLLLLLLLLPLALPLVLFLLRL